MKHLSLFFFFILFSFKALSTCELYDLTIDKSDCNKDKKFFLTFNFKYKDVSDCFTIKGNGKNYGTFLYSKLPITIGPLSGDCITEYEFIIRDCKAENCKLTEFYGNVCCETECQLSDLKVEKAACDDNGKFCVVLNFNHSGNSKCFKVSGNGKEYGKFSYSQLPLKICGLLGDCDTEYEFIVSDCENLECSTSNELGIVCCEKPCKLSDLKLEKTDCDDLGRFYVLLNFKYKDGSTCFIVKGNGKNYGKFNYSQLPIKLGPFEGDCKTNYEFNVSDCEKINCSVSKELGKVCCEKKKCEIKELKILKTDCNPSNNFYVIINFKYFNTSTSFKVKGNGTNYGTFNYSQLPIKIGPLKGDCLKQYEFIVYDCEMETCKASKNIGKVCCEFKKDKEDELKQKDDPKILEHFEKWQTTYEVETFTKDFNQTSDNLLIRFNHNTIQDIKVNLINSFGVNMMQSKISRSENLIALNTFELLPGLYILVMNDNNRQQVFKFMKR